MILPTVTAGRRFPPDMYNDPGFVSQPQLYPVPADPDRSSAPADATADEHAMLYCPVCSMRLESRKCKLFCAKCGYYLSCADYY